MTDNTVTIDADTLAALKVLRGDNNKKDDNAIDKVFTSGLTNQIVNALSAQKETSATQTAELIEVVREQTAVLQKLTELLLHKEQQQQQASPVASNAAAETEVDILADTGDIVEASNDAAVETDDSPMASNAAVEEKPVVSSATEASNAAVEEKPVVSSATEASNAAKTDDSPSTASTAAVEEKPVVSSATESSNAAKTDDSPSTASTAAVEEKPVVSSTTEPGISRGLWGFVESDRAYDRRSRVNKTNAAFRYLDKGEKVPEEAFVPVTSAQKLEKGDALFGKVSGGEQLIGDSFGEHWDRMRSRVNQYGKLQPPLWAATAKKSVRSFLPKLAYAEQSTIALNSGVYYLTVKYEEEKSASPVEAAIIIGEIAFENSGKILAPGANWAKLLNGDTQFEGVAPPSKSNGSSAKVKWYSATVSEPWKNGDILRFKIDTNTNTVVYTLTATGDEESKAGWRFENVLAFTNVPTNPDNLRAFAYCGGKGKISSSAVKLTIVD